MMQAARISSTTRKDILNDPQGYPQQPARISSTTRKDILNDPQGYPCKSVAIVRCKKSCNTTLQLLLD